VKRDRQGRRKRRRSAEERCCLREARKSNFGSLKGKR
jgi:hypothetical protein